MYFIDAIKALCPISEETEHRLVKATTPCCFPKRYRLVRDGEYGHSAYFLEKGMTRSFWIVDGEEITTSFSCEGGEGGIVFSMDELCYGHRSEEVAETLEKTTARRIALDDLRELFNTNLELANRGRIIHQNEYRRLHRSHKERLSLPAEERYEAFRRQFPDICRWAQLGCIASYLGISLSTLSRLRAKKGKNAARI